MCKLNCSGGCPECAPDEHVDYVVLGRDLQMFVFPTYQEAEDAAKKACSELGTMACVYQKIGAAYPTFPGINYADIQQDFSTGD